MLKFLVFCYHKHDLMNNLWNKEEDAKDKFQIYLENTNYLSYSKTHSSVARNMSIFEWWKMPLLLLKVNLIDSDCFKCCMSHWNGEQNLRSLGLWVISMVQQRTRKQNTVRTLVLNNDCWRCGRCSLTMVKPLISEAEAEQSVVHIWCLLLIIILSTGVWVPKEVLEPMKNLILHV